MEVHTLRVILHILSEVSEDADITREREREGGGEGERERGRRGEGERREERREEREGIMLISSSCD